MIKSLKLPNNRYKAFDPFIAQFYGVFAITLSAIPIDGPGKHVPNPPANDTAFMPEPSIS
ncbi:MAG: hypothetical protein O2967_18700 [Proteobacteria bacterium]|nr:hypothetical protein [Pseudomonadota bacterium]